MLFKNVLIAASGECYSADTDLRGGRILPETYEERHSRSGYRAYADVEGDVTPITTHGTAHRDGCTGRTHGYNAVGHIPAEMGPFRFNPVLGCAPPPTVAVYHMTGDAEIDDLHGPEGYLPAAHSDIREPGSNAPAQTPRVEHVRASIIADAAEWDGKPITKRGIGWVMLGV